MAQTKQQTFLKLTDPNGQMIRGTSTQRFYERQIIASFFSGVSSGNPQIQFTMPPGAASAALTNLIGSKQNLLNGLFSITQYGETGLALLYSVRLEDIKVISVREGEGGTNVTLQASRIGTTYYQYDRRTGQRVVSGKTGFDFTSNSNWNNF